MGCNKDIWITRKDIRLIQEMYKNYTFQVEHTGKLSELTTVKSGVKKGMPTFAYFILNGTGHYDDKYNEQEKRCAMGTT